MSRLLSDLKPEMRIKAENIKKKCEMQGVDILIYYTTRTLKEQAILFRQSFIDYVIIDNKIKVLEKQGYDFLSKIIKDVGSQKYTGWVTSAAPGESWHNYGYAIDAAPTKGKDVLWSYEGNENEWNIYGEACESEGLYWGGLWKKKDYPHAQYFKDNNPLRLYTPEEIRKMLNI